MKKLLLVIWLACLAVGFSARGQAVIDPNNTIVRFNVFTGGTNFGHIDVELFDQQKPETVRNFLLYVYSGQYSNILLHSLVPQKFLQAGHVQIHDPFGTNQFATFDRTASFGIASNEYSAGPQLPNDFGTIAMVPQPFQGFSVGSIDWIINLTNNTELNTNNGYVVFGHVVNTQGEHGGTNLLKFFHSFTLFNNIRGVLLENAAESFDVPVTEYHGERFPMTREMFLVVASVIHAGVAHDRVAPTVQVTEPGGNVNLETAGPAHFEGTAADNQRVSRIIYDFGFPHERFIAAPGAASWSANIPLFPRTNVISIRSVDDFGNMSEPVQRTIYYPFAPINLQVFGKGKVIGLTNGQSIRLDHTNIAEARPAPGNYFLGWRGNFLSNERLISFVISEFTNEFGFIEFPTNIFVYFSKTFLGLSNGTYQGIFFPITNGTLRSGGSISINLNANGRYAGSLKPNGANYQISGFFGTNAGSHIEGWRGSTLLTLDLTLTDNPAAQAIFGWYNDGVLPPSRVAMYRAPKYSKTNPAPLAGTYSFLISPTADASTEAGDGYGFGSVTIDALGKIKMTGTLGDETAIKQTAKVLQYNQWAFHAVANGGREAVVGLMRFDTNSSTFTNIVQWWAPHFPGGTNQVASLAGARYTNGVPLNWTNGTVTFTDETLEEPLSADVVLEPNGSITVLSNTNNVQFSAPDAKGQVTGSFMHPVSGQITPLRGATLQSSNIVGGFFGVKTNNGGFVIRRRP